MIFIMMLLEKEVWTIQLLDKGQICYLIHYIDFQIFLDFAWWTVVFAVWWCGDGLLYWKGWNWWNEKKSNCRLWMCCTFWRVLDHYRNMFRGGSEINNNNNNTSVFLYRLKYRFISKRFTTYKYQTYIQITNYSRQFLHLQI